MSERFPFKLSGKYGFINENSEVVVPPQYKSAAYSMHEGMACVGTAGLKGLIDLSGNWVLKDDGLEFGFRLSSGLIPVIREKRYGFINMQGETLVPPQFDFAGNFIDGLALINIGGKRGSGKWEDWGSPLVGGKYGFIDNSGKFVVEPTLAWADNFREGIGRFCILGKWSGKGDPDTPIVKSKWGFYDNTGNAVIPAQFDYAENFENGYAAVRKGKLWGIIGRDGSYVCPSEYIKVREFSEGLAAVFTAKSKNIFKQLSKIGAGILGGWELTGYCEWGFIDEKGRMAIAPQFNWINGNFKDGLAPVTVGEKRGLIDRKGNFVVKPIYESIYEVSNGRAAFQDESKKWGLLDCKGNIVVPPTFDEIPWPGSFNDGLLQVKSGGLTGFVNMDGKFAIEPRFTSANDFKNGIAIVEENRLHGAININGDYLVEPRFYSLRDGGDNLLYAQEPEQHGFINSDGAVVIPPQFSSGVWDSQFSEGLAPVQKGTKWGYINKKGEFVIPPKFDSARSFSEGLAFAGKGDKLGIINTKGEWIAESKDFSGLPFECGYAKVSIYDPRTDHLLYGLIDRSGKEVIPCRFAAAGHFHDGFARVYVDEKGERYAGFIDADINFHFGKFEQCTDFSEGLAGVQPKDKYGYIDTSGNYVIPCQFDKAQEFSDGLATVKVGNLWGYISHDGKFAIPLQFEDAFSFDKGIAPVRIKGKWGAIDTAGKYLVQPEFDRIWPWDSDSPSWTI